MIGYTNLNRLEKRQQFLKEFIENVDKVKMGKMFYQSAIDVWTKRDVLKRETAKKNHLKYMVFWNQDLSDFYQWIKKGCQIKNSY